MLLLVVALLVSCNEVQRLQPSAAGKPYEVLLVGDTNNIVARSLQQDVAGLSTPEPSFDLTAITPKQFKGAFQQARNIVVVTVNPQNYTRFSITWEGDVYVANQLVVRIGAPNPQVLERGMRQKAVALRQLLTRHEMERAIELLKQRRNTHLERELERTTHLSLMVPEDMTASKQNHNFMWMSNNAPDAERCIVVYRATENDDGNIQRFIAERDSALHRNIPGEKTGSYPFTIASTVQRSRTSINGKAVWVYRGLWAMQNDDMGGPFVSLSYGDIRAEAFLFSPGRPQRNNIRQLEAALLTLKNLTNK